MGGQATVVFTEGIAMTNTTRILVTGGGGFLGKAIVKRLVKAKAAVVSLSRNHYDDLDRLGVRQIQGDVSDPAAVQKAVAGCATVFHTAARFGIWGKYDDYYRTNVVGTRNIVASCLDQGVQHLVHTSSPSVVFNGEDMQNVDESVPYPDRQTAHYPRTKALAEQTVRDAADKLPVIILRPHLIWGPEDNQAVPRILARARSGRLVRIGNGRNRVDTIYIDNAARAHIQAWKAISRDTSLSGNVYFISQGEPIPLWDMVDAILKAGGLPPVKRTVSVRTARVLAWLLETAYHLLPLGGEPPLTRFAVEELSTSHWFCIDAARRDLGYRPEVSIAEGLQRLSRWLDGTANNNAKEISKGNIHEA